MGLRSRGSTLLLSAVVAFATASVALADSIVAWGRDHWCQVSCIPDAEFQDIGGGQYHSLAVRTDGTIGAWGYDEIGGQVSKAPEGDGFVAVDGGTVHSLALKEDGSLQAWGVDSGGQWDWGQVTNTPDGDGFVMISAEGYTNFALLDPDHDDVGTIVGWGRNDIDFPDDADLIDDIPEGDDFVAVEAGYFHALALKSDGSIVAWGPSDGGYHDRGQVTGTPSGNNFIAIAAGMYFSMAIEDLDGDGMGSLSVWGSDYYGQQSGKPEGSDFIRISVGDGHCLALRADGTVEAWGYDLHGQAEVPPGLHCSDIEAGGSHNLVLVSPCAAITEATYDGDTLLSTSGQPNVSANLVASLRDDEGNVLDIDGEEVTFALTADGVESIVVPAVSQDGSAHAVQMLEPAIYSIDITLASSDVTGFGVLVVYNPDGGHATGGGWIVPEDDGQNTHPNERANFGFNAKYRDDDPTGHLEFRYSDGYVDLKSTSIELLVITGGKIVQFKGWARVNGEDGWWFFVKGIDNADPGRYVDEFDIKAWAPGVDPEGDPTERAGGALAGGNIVVHRH